MIKVTLDCPWAFRVSSVIDGSITKSLLQFIREIDVLKGGWKDARIFKTPDEDLVISCFECWQGEVSMEVSLDSAWDDPEWTVQLRLNVGTDKWHDFAVDYNRFVTSDRRHSL